MDAFLYSVTYRKPILDLGWRTAIYPAGTLLADALAQETTVQGEHGNTIDPTTAVLLPYYFMRGTADYLPDLEQRNDDDHGWRDVVTQTHAVVLRYRMSGPKVHNP